MVEPIHRYNFLLDVTFLEQAMFKLQPAADIVVDLKNDQRVGYAFESDYLCLICTNVVWQAK